MRILQVIHGFLPQFRGGTELHLFGLARELRALGHEVEIVSGTTHSVEEATVDRYVHDGFPVHKIVLSGTYLEHWTRSLCPEATRLFAGVLREVRPDLVHVHHWYRLSRDLIETCHGLGVPAVCTLHDLWTSCPRIFRIRDETSCERPVGAESCLDCVPRFPWAKDAETATEIDLFRDDFVNELRLARRIIVPSRAHGDLIRRMTSIPDETLAIIPHGSIVELEADRDAPPAAREAGGKIRLGVWGHLFHMKGVHLVLEALRKAKLSRAFELHVWGRVVEPRYKERLERSARGLDVVWHGAFTPVDLRDVALDLAVIPTICSESFSFVLDEAFDMGLPAIVPDRGALPERLSGAGAVFEAESASSLAKVLARVAAKPDLVRGWSEAIPELTSLTWNAREILHLYGQVLAEESEFAEKPDDTLPARRIEFLSEVRVANERAMFSHLGHIKRETGRANHYQQATEAAIARQHELGAEMGELGRRHGAELEALRRELAAENERMRLALESELERMHAELKRLQTELESVRAELDGGREAVRSAPALAVLAREVLDFRALLSDVDADRPHLDRDPGEVPDVDTPFLGSLPDAVAENSKIMDRFAARIAERNAVLALVGGEIVAFRELIAALSTDAAFERGAVEPPETDVDVPGLGPPSAIVADDDAILMNFFEGERGRRAAAAERSNAMLREIETLRRGLMRAEEVLGVRSDDDDAPERLPTDVAIERLVELDRELLIAYEDRIGQLRGLRDEVGTLQVSLAAKTILIERLGAFVEDLRAALVAVHAERPEVPDFDEVVECPDEHVPGLGDLRTVRDVNSALVRDALAHVRALKDGQVADGSAPAPGPESDVDSPANVRSDDERPDDEPKDPLRDLRDEVGTLQVSLATKAILIERLGAFVEDLRAALVAVHAERPEMPDPVEVGECPDEHVPGLGDLRTVRDVNSALVRDALAHVRALKEGQAAEDPESE